MENGKIEKGEAEEGGGTGGQTAGNRAIKGGGARGGGGRTAGHRARGGGSGGGGGQAGGNRAGEGGGGGGTGGETAGHRAEGGGEGEGAGDVVEFEGLVGVCLVEGFGSDLEAEVLHLEEDVVFAAEYVDGEVTKGVVPFLVVDIEEGGDFREVVGNGLEEVLCLSVFFLGHHAELDEEHQSSRIGGTYHHAAEESCVLALVVECEAAVVGIIPYEQSDAVVDGFHEVAFLDGQYLIEGSCCMESHALLMLELLATAYLFLRQPASVAKSEFQFVAIFLDLL